MQEHSWASDTEKAENAKRILESKKQDVKAYARGAVAELSRQLLTCKAETKRKKLERGIRRWQLVLDEEV